MDADRFDTLARTLSDPASRRTLLSTSLAGLMAALGLTRAEAKKKKKGKGKKKKGKDKDNQDTTSGPDATSGTDPGPGPISGCGPCDQGCCDGSTCRDFSSDFVMSDFYCGKNGDPCIDCHAQGLSCNSVPGICICNQAQCFSQRGCCDGEVCIAGTAHDACGSDGHACHQCLETEICGDKEGLRYCCAMNGQPCGEVTIYVLGIPVGTKDVVCCEGLTCGDDKLCHNQVPCNGACNPTNQFCCGNASGGRHNVCLYTTGLNCPIPESNFVANCPSSDGTCCTHELFSTCPQTPGECPPGETPAGPVTCND